MVFYSLSIVITVQNVGYGYQLPIPMKRARDKQRRDTGYGDGIRLIMSLLTPNISNKPSPICEIYLIIS